MNVGLVIAFTILFTLLVIMAVYIVRVREREANRDIESTFALIDAVPNSL